MKKHINFKSVGKLLLLLSFSLQIEAGPISYDQVMINGVSVQEQAVQREPATVGMTRGEWHRRNNPDANQPRPPQQAVIRPYNDARVSAFVSERRQQLDLDLIRRRFASKITEVLKSNKDQIETNNAFMKQILPDFDLTVKRGLENRLYRHLQDNYRTSESLGQLAGKINESSKGQFDGLSNRIEKSVKRVLRKKATRAGPALIIAALVAGSANAKAADSATAHIEPAKPANLGAHDWVDRSSNGVR